jgi:hypothetical protein
MINVLRSLDVAIELPAEFLARCGRAIARIQVDLDGTGFARFQMHPANASVGRDGLPAVYAALPDGSWDGSAQAMTPDMDDAILAHTAAEQISDSLALLERVFWPTCVRHAGPPMTFARSTPDSQPAWHCERGAHVVALLVNSPPATSSHCDHLSRSLLARQFFSGRAAARQSR